ncbi:MAG: sulfurtransferase [Gammaproteobacteria bacterium]|nr:sulfurtransferase [Gammaproteobacteria bacterium]MYK47609.1 sulfurtransferase [Gammaproteobacteria bacterium]
MPYAHPEYLISPAELAADLDNPTRRVLDATVYLTPASRGYRADSGLAKFKACHVPGAQFLDLVEAASDTGTGLGFSLPAVSQLESLFQSLGVDNDSEVVFYSTGHMMWATRAWWLLRYCGHRNAKVLNGGFRAWRKGRHPTTREVSPPPAGNFVARPQPALFADKEAVLAAIGNPGVCTVNALSPDVFSGEGRMHYGRKGHIAGSVNVFYDDLMDHGIFKEDAALRRALDAKGLLDAPRIIAYCGGGISATVDAFACLLLGHTDVAVYDGSMAEWVRDESLPMETGP